MSEESIDYLVIVGLTSYSFRKIKRSVDYAPIEIPMVKELSI